MLRALLNFWRRTPQPRANIPLTLNAMLDREFREALKHRQDQRWSKPRGRFYAREGEFVTCEGPGNHPIVEIAYDVKLGDWQRPDHFGQWFQTPLPWGSLADRCTCEICGARWYDGMGHYHFNDGWRR